MATVGRWFATWIQEVCSLDMSPTRHRAARDPKQPCAISSCATHTDQSMPSCYGLSERLSIPADFGDRPSRELKRALTIHHVPSGMSADDASLAGAAFGHEAAPAGLSRSPEKRSLHATRQR